MTPQDPLSYVRFIFLFDLFAKSRCWIFSHLSKVIVYFKAFTPGSFVIPPSASCRFPPFCHFTTQRIACHSYSPLCLYFYSGFHFSLPCKAIPFGLSVAERSRRPLHSLFFDSAAGAATLRTNGHGSHANENRSKS